MDVEIPVTDLQSPSPCPTNASDIPTVLFRVFYPAVDDSEQNNIPWLPAPQRHHISAYTRFVGISNVLAELFSYVFFFLPCRTFLIATGVPDTD